MKIESVQNATIKSLAKLKNKKERDESRTFLVEGLHMIQEAKAAGLLDHVYQLDTFAPIEDVPVTFCSQTVLNKLSAQKSDARAIGVCRRPALQLPDVPKRMLLLDRIQDPGNLGTLIRSACAFGFEGVICSPDCADFYSPKTLQSSQGALFHIPCMQSDLLKTIDSLKARNIEVFGAALHADSKALASLSIPPQCALVIGNEGQGISRSVLDACSSLVHIEMAAFESLNAAIAGSILMYEIMIRQNC